MSNLVNLSRSFIRQCMQQNTRHIVRPQLYTMPRYITTGKPLFMLNNNMTKHIIKMPTMPNKFNKHYHSKCVCDHLMDIVICAMAPIGLIYIFAILFEIFHSSSSNKK